MPPLSHVPRVGGAPEALAASRRTPITAHESKNGSANLSPVRLIAVSLFALVLFGCSSDEESAPPPPAETENVRLLDGGVRAFEAYVKKHKGRPVVVNKWASWCGPCRAEFPFFGRQAKKLDREVVFVGVNSDDNDADAREFLSEYPVPFPSFKDPDLKVAAAFNGVQAFPATAYYDRKGELAYVHQGQYLRESDLVEDIDKYAR
jgi:cytochrome c biogenesis protein CcmG, thiol:disulfide interchange protein DsbE